MIAQSKTELFQVFKSFDKDSSGFVDKSELIFIAKQLNQELSNQEVDKVMRMKYLFLVNGCCGCK